MKSKDPAVPTSNLRFIKAAALSFLFLILQFTLSAPLAAQPDTTATKNSDRDSEIASFIALTSTVFPVILGLSVESPVALALIPGGLIFGPVTGYSYMGNTRLGMRYAGKRAIVLGGTIGAIYAICATGDCSFDLFGDETGSEFGLAVTIGIAGTFATVFMNMKDTFSIGRRVKSRRLVVTPAYFLHERATGLRALARF